MDKERVNKIMEEIIGKCETEEEKEYMKKFLEGIQDKERQKKEMVEKTDYIKWLETFTKEHPSFSDDTWLYKQDEISKEDYEKVCKISTFFSAIDKYADENYIEASVSSAGREVSYFIKYNEKIYEIGTVVGQGAVSYCCVTDYCSKTTAVGNCPVINFEEIAKPSESTRVRTALVENQLERIDDLLNILASNKKLNIPIEAIITRTNKVLKELKEKTK